MTTTKRLPHYSKTEWIIAGVLILLFICVDRFALLSPLIRNPLFYASAFIITLYYTHFRQTPLPIKKRLATGYIGGAFALMLIESLATLAAYFLS